MCSISCDLHLNEYRFPHSKEVILGIMKTVSSKMLSEFPRPDLHQRLVDEIASYCDVTPEEVLLVNGDAAALSLVKRTMAIKELITTSKQMVEEDELSTVHLDLGL